MGEKHGSFKEYNEDGDLESIKTYANDEKNGYWKDTKYNGDIEEGYYTNGKRSGHWKFFEDGNLEQEGPYFNGKKHGEWKFYGTNIYSKKTRLNRKGQYNNGQQNGKWVYYNKDGNQNEYSIYENGNKVKNVKDGIHFNYNTSRSFVFIDSEKHYKNNRLVKTIKYVFKNNDVNTNTIVDKETWINGKLVSKASKPKERFYRVYVKNKCRQKISVAIRGITLENDVWESKGWWNIASGEESYVFDTKNGIIYYYAESRSFKWYGEHRKNIRGKFYNFRKKDISKNNYGKTVVSLNCNN
jgi:antitoxin component YwqK of YwqJK toxin-antitoxin module